MAESFRPRAPAGCVADTELLRERFSLLIIPVIGGLIRAKLLIMRGWSTTKEANPLPITGSLPARSSGRTKWQPYGRLSTLAGRATPQRSSPAETARLRPGLTL